MVGSNNPVHVPAIGFQPPQNPPTVQRQHYTYRIPTCAVARSITPGYPCRIMTNVSPDFTQRLAKFAAGIAGEAHRIPPPVADLCRDLMLNAAALAGAAHPDGIALVRFVRETGGPPNPSFPRRRESTTHPVCDRTFGEHGEF